MKYTIVVVEEIEVDSYIIKIDCVHVEADTIEEAKLAAFKAFHAEHYGDRMPFHPDDYVAQYVFSGHLEILK